MLKYPDSILRLYQSEVNGEAIYLALLRVASNDRERYHLATLLQLETETKAWLQPFLFKHRVQLVVPDIASLVAGAVHLYQAQGWQALMLAAREVVNAALAEFQAIAALGPSSDAPYLQGMVRHERAIQSWVEAELQGPSESSLDPVIALLSHPIVEHKA